MNSPENDNQDINTRNSGSSNSKAAHSNAPVEPAKPEANPVILNCPYCRKKFDRASTKSMPFCSPRCKQIDLGLWLNEVHSMPYEVDPNAFPESD